MKTPAFLLALAATAALSFAQSVTVSVQGPASANPGDTVTLSVVADVSGLPASGAIAGYGLDLDVTAGASAVTGLSAASSPVLTLGVLPGAPGAASLDRAVGGQISNINNLNPAVDQSTTLTLFTTDLTLDANGSGSVTIAASSATPEGGIVLYGDVTQTGTIRVPADAGTSLSFVDLTISVGAADCPGDATGDNLVDGADLLAVINNFGATGGSAGDVTDDGAVDGADLLEVINNFGGSC